MLKTLAVFTGAVTLLASAAFAQSDPFAGHTREQRVIDKEAIALVQEVEEVGRDVRYHVERLASFPSPGSVESRWTHDHHLTEIKELVNDRLRPALTRLVQIQALLPDWKQETIDQMLGSARELSADASSAFVTKAKNSTMPPAMNEEYRTFVAGMTKHAEALVKTSDAAHSYASAHLKATEAGLPVNK